MTEEDLRRLVRESLERYLGRSASDAPGPPVLRLHPSHTRFGVTSGSQEGGPCLIEPAVQCIHCGYCQSLGY